MASGVREPLVAYVASYEPDNRRGLSFIAAGLNKKGGPEGAALSPEP